MDASNFLANIAGPIGVAVLVTASFDTVRHARFLRQHRDGDEMPKKTLGDIYDNTIGATFLAAIVMFFVLLVAAMIGSANHGDTKERGINRDIAECVERGGVPSVKATNWDGTEYEFGECSLP